MNNIKQGLRTGVLYLTAIMLACGVPLAAVAHAEEPETYSYNAETGRWDSSKWRYDAATNTYVPVVTPQPTPPPAPTEEPAPEQQQAAEEAPAAALDATAIDTTGQGSNNSTDSASSANSTRDIDNKSTINNKLDADATTGNASVNKNGKAGDAGTGNANADATVINSVHSTVSGDNGGVAHFTADIYGDINGNITLGPNLGGNTSATKTVNNNRETNVDNDASITNDINLKAKSGDADVTENTEAGSASSGDANAMVNIINLVNTIIGANKSFVGTVNIHGNLYGDIIISSDFIPQLIASNSDAVMTMDMPLSTNITDDQEIVNNINLAATTGDASVDGNTEAGNASTGNAQTKLTVLNLTGREVDAENATLVFVNVKGKWVGLIVDAPGATAAAFGGGMTKNTVKDSSELNVTNKAAITNNINVEAESGDASVASNTKAGGAKTGNATAGANISNISNSKLNIRDFVRWIFITIDGDWVGKLYFALFPETGEVLPISVPTNTPAAPGATGVQFGFQPSETPQRTAKMIMEVTDGAALTDQDTPPEVRAVLASATPGSMPPAEPTTLIPQSATYTRGIDPLAIGLMVAGGLIAIAPLSLGFIRRRTALLALLRP